MSSGGSDSRLLEYIDEIKQNSLDGSRIRNDYLDDHEFQKRCDTVDKVVLGEMCSLTKMLAITQMEVRGLRNLQDAKSLQPGDHNFRHKDLFCKRALDQISKAQVLKEEMGNDYMELTGGSLDS